LFSLWTNGVRGRQRLGQTLEGFGGAFTDAAALMYKSLPEDKQKQILDMYFGPEGIGFTVGRVHIDCCDFSPRSYSFDSGDGDLSLANFDEAVSHDAEAMIPLIVAAQSLVRAQGRRLKLIAAPWSPSAWMETNGQMAGSGNGALKDTCNAIWASYFAKWLTAYKSHGVVIRAVTPQSEPENPAFWEEASTPPSRSWNSWGSTWAPQIRHDHPDVKIIIFDHNEYHVHD